MVRFMTNRVAVLIDGKNYHSGWRTSTGGREVSLERVLAWVSDQVKGDLDRCLYYTGVEDKGVQEGLDRYLSQIEKVPGVEVRRFPRRLRHRPCGACAHVQEYTQEKGVDTSIVADMVALAGLREADTIVLVSGDEDLVPGILGAQRLGARVFVATWGGYGLSGTSRAKANGTLDLVRVFNTKPPEDEVLEELGKAEKKFRGQFVGFHYFLTGWKGPGMPASPERRRTVVEHLLDQHLVETFETRSGAVAIRRV